MNEMVVAIESNDVAAVKRLLTDGSVDVNARIADGLNSPLLALAADLGHVEIVALLLDAGARIDDIDDVQNTASHVAARNNHVDVVELLVARNANWSLRNRGNRTPISIAIYSKNERLVMLLIDAAMAAGTPPGDELICLAATVSADVVRLLLFKHRIDLSVTRDDHGRTPLHCAVLRKSDASVFNLLIEVAGVDVDARDESGCTAALDACIVTNIGALACLVAAGANLELADDDGDTPLHCSRVATADEIAVLLLAAGANVHARNNKGRTVCHDLCERSHVSLPVLMAFGANLDEPANDGITPWQLLNAAPPTTEEIEAARRRVVNVQLSLVRKRAFDVCVGLQSRGLDALCTCEILLHSCGPVAPFVPFHRWWQIATTIKHFRGSNIEN